MAAGEDQAQAGRRARVPPPAARRRRCSSGRLRLAAVAGRLPAQPVERLVAGRGDDPAARVGRDAVAGQRSRGDGEGLLDRLLGEVDVAEDADQGGDARGPDSSRKTRSMLGPPIPTGSGTCYAPPGSSWNGRTSTGPPQAAEPLAAHQGRVQVGGLDDPEAADLLLGLRERPVGRDDARCRNRRQETLCGSPKPCESRSMP